MASRQIGGVVNVQILDLKIIIFKMPFPEPRKNLLLSNTPTYQ